MLEGNKFRKNSISATDCNCIQFCICAVMSLMISGIPHPVI